MAAKENLNPLEYRNKVQVHYAVLKHLLKQDLGT